MFSSSLFAISSIDVAVIKAGIKTNDSLDVKISKALWLLNDKHYLEPSKNVKVPPPPFNNQYHLDSMRTPEEILAQKFGGHCGSTALAFAAILTASGVNPSDIQIVSAVVNHDLKLICPIAGKPREPHPHSGASGHVFVAVRFSNKEWKIINTTDSSKNYAKTNWYSPGEIEQRMKNEAIAIPTEACKNMPESICKSGLTVFHSCALSEAPIHTFEQRLDLIASGKMNQTPAICRFTVK